MSEFSEVPDQTSSFATQAAALFAATTPGEWHVRVFVSAPATEKSKAIESRKISPIQRTALGSLPAGDAEFIAFVKNNWARIHAAIAAAEPTQ